MDIMRFTPPTKHDCYKKLRTFRHDGTLNTTMMKVSFNLLINNK